jgi:hypothetical protein
LVLFGLAAACSEPASPPTPWLYGLDGVVSSTSAPPVASPRDATGLDAELEPGCAAATGRSIELSAPLLASAGRGTVVASYRGGIVVFDPEHRVVATAPGYRCEGSADELEVVAFGHAWGAPTLAIVASSGGHHTAVRWVGLFRIGPDRRLDPTFAAAVEIREGERVERGAIIMLPDGLLYRRPGGAASLWRFDPVARAYVPIGPIAPSEPPHVPAREVSNQGSTPVVDRRASA